MTLQVDISLTRGQTQQIIEDLRALGGDVNAAVASAIPRAVRRARVVMVRAIAEDLAVPQKRLFKKGNHRLPVQERVSEGSGGKIAEGRLSVTGRRVALGRFAAKPVWKTTRRKRHRKAIKGRRHAGETHRITRGGSRAKVEKAFVVTFNSGHKKVYRRVGQGRSLEDGGAVRENFGPSIPHAAEQRPKVQNLISKDAALFLLTEANSQIDRVIGRGRSRRG